jgi:hypothetical protein
LDASRTGAGTSGHIHPPDSSLGFITIIAESDFWYRQAVSGPWVPGERPPPPPELDPVEQEAWRAITARLPADFSTAENKPMLKELVRHVRFADELAADLQSGLAEVAAGSDPGPIKLKALAALRKEQRELLRAHGYQTERIGNLSTKLRLTPQARQSARRGTSRLARSPQARGHGRIGATPPEKGPAAANGLPAAGIGEAFTDKTHAGAYTPGQQPSSQGGPLMSSTAADRVDRRSGCPPCSPPRTRRAKNKTCILRSWPQLAAHVGACRHHRRDRAADACARPRRPAAM